MGPPVRMVCVACLHSLEVSSGDDSRGPQSCPYCGEPVGALRHGPRASTTAEGLVVPPDPDASTPRDAPDPDPIPARIGRFVIREPLGEGGYGSVYRAYDPHLERDVALKVLKANRLGEKALERFYREARAAARLDHPHIVGLHDAGRDEGRCWIAYQLVEGQTLSMLRDVARPSVDESARVVRDLARALDHAHGRGVFHRDLKPANVLIDRDGRARLTDFGLARRCDLDSDLTREGTVLGTPQYMSPEAAAGRAREADGRSDVYSLGVILYELICGKRPADAPSNVPLWRSTRLASPATPRSVDRAIPAALDRVCMKALAFDPDDRYPDARSFADALDAYLKKRPTEPSPTPAREPARIGRLTIGLLVATSVLFVALGISLKPAGRSASVASRIATEARTRATLLDREAVDDLSPIPSKVVHTTVEPAPAPPPGPSPAAPEASRLFVVRTIHSNVYHLPDGCSSAKAISAEHRQEIDFSTDEEVLALHLKPCLICEPHLMEARKCAPMRPNTSAFR